MNALPGGVSSQLLLLNPEGLEVTASNKSIGYDHPDAASVRHVH